MMNAELRDIIAKAQHHASGFGVIPWQNLTERERGVWRESADAVLANLRLGWLFTSEDARLMRLAIDWIASELRDQKIPSSEYVGTRTFLNEMITRFDQYAALVGSEIPWVRGEQAS